MDATSWFFIASESWHINPMKIFQFYKALDQWEHDLDNADQ